MTCLVDDRDFQAQRYADRLLQESDWRLPKLVLVRYKGYLRPDQAKAEFLHAHQNRMPTVYEPSGPMMECYSNVLKMVKENGGELILGWQITPHMLCEHGIHMEAHAVWRAPDGRLVEVTVGRPTWHFASSQTVQLGHQIVITTEKSAQASILIKQSRQAQTTGQFESMRNPLWPMTS